MEHVEVIDTVSGPVFARFSAKLRHIDLTQTPEVDVLHETWTVTVYKRTENFLLDIKSEIQAVGDSALTIEEYHYGGMAIRGSGQWFNPEEDQDETRSVDAPWTWAGRLYDKWRRNAQPCQPHTAPLGVYVWECGWASRRRSHDGTS